ncbi:hypothetical protein E4Z66_15675 [Aliishimia ponticola]|uniref:Uncharacterized protein n=1 Tax=Aliishimia ponticola TaxID=2499833 RepID=A0A4S4NGQ6_9RHOB|nr:hypothetical protein [Aliishimia ponticola]THH35260.1 hypothetical protein E4Z66_15675 [Aliishimia ponticola]
MANFQYSRAENRAHTTQHHHHPGQTPEELIAQFAADVVRGRIKDVKTLLLARTGPVTRQEIDILSNELRKLEQPNLARMGNPRNLDATLSEISMFGERRRVLSDYRQCLHDILQLQHRAEALSRSEGQLHNLRRSSRGADFDTAADLKARIKFWETTVERDRNALVAIEDRLKADFPLSLPELRRIIALQDS